jgi:hypothetical protein
LDACTRRAVTSAVLKTWPNTNKPAPFLPLVLGGDDLTAICDGTKAVEFTENYLLAFNSETMADKDVQAVFAQKGKPQGVGAAAGVAIVKPHFPFHRAYELSANLTESAKAVKQHSEGATALDFEVVFDTSTADIRSMRERRDPSASTHLTFRPYIVSVPDGVKDAWIEARLMAKLRARMAPLISTREQRGAQASKPKLPRAQVHMLRNALSFGPDTVEVRLREIYSRYPKAFGIIAPEKRIFIDAAGEAGITRTYFLDAVDLAEIEGA